MNKLIKLLFFLIIPMGLNAQLVKIGHGDSNVGKLIDTINHDFDYLNDKPSSNITNDNISNWNATYFDSDASVEASISGIVSEAKEVATSSVFGMVTHTHPQNKAYNIGTYSPVIYQGDTAFNTVTSTLSNGRIVYDRTSGIKFVERVGSLVRSVDPSYNNLGNVYTDDGWNFNISIQKSLDKTGDFIGGIFTSESKHCIYSTMADNDLNNHYLMKSYNFGKTFVWASDSLLAKTVVTLPTAHNYVVTSVNYKEFESFGTDKGSRFTTTKFTKTYDGSDGSQVFTVSTATNNLTVSLTKINTFDTTQYYYVEYKAKGNLVTSSLSNFSGKIPNLSIISDPALTGSYQTVKYMFKPVAYNSTLYIIYPNATGNSGKYIQIDSLKVYTMDTITEGVNFFTRYNAVSNAKLFANAINTSMDMFAQVNADNTVNVYSYSFGKAGNNSKLIVNGTTKTFSGARDYNETIANVYTRCLLPGAGVVNGYNAIIQTPDDSVMFGYHDNSLNIYIAKCTLGALDDVYHSTFKTKIILPTSHYAEPVFTRYNDTVYMSLRYQDAGVANRALSTYPYTSIWKSLNNGRTWTVINTGLPSNKVTPQIMIVPKWDSRSLTYRDDIANDPYVVYNMFIVNHHRYVGVTYAYTFNLSTHKLSKPYLLSNDIGQFKNYYGASNYNGYKVAGNEGEPISAVFSERYKSIYYFYVDASSTNTQKESVWVKIIRN